MVCKMRTRQYDVIKFTEIFCHLFLDTEQVSSVSDFGTSWTKNGIYKGQTLVR